VNPLMGHDAVAPFLSRQERGAFIVARSSNPGAADLLDTEIADHATVYSRIVELGLGWDPGGTVGFVVGATEPSVVAWVRRAAPGAPLRPPGVGTQGRSPQPPAQPGTRAGGGRHAVSAAAPDGDRPVAASTAARARR